ncbi:uncharacterized protein J4E84_008376 [Alternaria hordeiaustralica]|uniref:uncharacterized protein n=1 Tax=Alternaria hordeiaustralica TaxID=1187925 RepID=UPI0020C2790F|nr:uncharacterized protein J4E84_008376 [Alternaria hordeiaustralica]KAI4679348.1 hypothetical protein J4E84_008376 [Alternaria hordeiaustralica]
MALQQQQSASVAPRNEACEESPYGIFVEEDFIDDSTGIVPTKGLGIPLSLKDRFLRRLSKMLGTAANIREIHTGNAMDIFLTRDKQSPRPSVALDEGLREFVRELEDGLAAVAMHPSGPRLDHACSELWDVILLFNYNRVEQVIRSIQKTFDENRNTFEELVTRMFGIDDMDKKGSLLDRDLGDKIIRLSHDVHAFDGSMKELNQLVQFASTMTRVLLNLRDRMRYILERTYFANKLFDLICSLGFPERVYSTLIRAARSSQTFRNVTFHLRPSSPAKNVSFATPMASATPPNTIKPSSPPKKEKSKRMQQYEATAIETAIAGPIIPSLPLPLPSPPPQPAPTSLGSLMSAVQPYLNQKDRDLALHCLQPATKRETAQLVGTVLRERLLQMETAAWFSFGFVTAKDEEQERQLAGLYVAILKEAEDPEAAFRELQAALETNSIVELFDQYEYSHFRDLFPYLKAFLTTPPRKRSTVWRLRQFIQDPTDDEPPACLQRDYGFKYCRQREEVLRLKEIYIKILKKLGPQKLDIACVNGRLSETAMKEGVYVDQKDKRFLKNDYGSPFLGLDCEGGLQNYRGPFYRKPLKL